MNACPSGVTTHAMITADGQTVAVNYDPATGQYVTPDGQAFMIATPGDEQAGVPGEEGEAGVEGQPQIEAMETEGQEGQEGMDEHQQQAMVEHQQQQAATADLSSLAEAAETHHVMVDMHQGGDGQAAAVGETVSYQTVGGQTIRIVKKEPDTGQHQLSQQAVHQMVQQQQQQAQPQYKIMNPDGTLSDIPASSQPQQVRVIGADGTVTMRLMNPDGTFVEDAPPPAPSPQPALQQIRIVNSDGTVTMGTVGGNQRIVQQQQPVQQAQQNIRVLNSDGTITSLNSSNIRLAMQQQATPPPEPKVRIVTTSATGGQSPIKTTMTLSQAQQLGLIPQNATTGGNVKILPKSPTKTIRTTSDGRTVIVQSPSKQQIVIRGGQGGSRFGSQGQVLRIPNSSPGGTTIQKMNIGGKVQYVRVSNDTIRKSVSATSGQGLTLKNMTVLPPNSVQSSQGQVLRVNYPAQNHAIKRVVTPKQNSFSGGASRASRDEEMFPPDDEPDDVKPNIKQEPPEEKYESSGVKHRKPCNCTKSHCLKLYCECFANGEFCHNCNCNNCMNNLDNEKQRQKAIKQCLDRNPGAFKPKIGQLTGADGERRHHRGCHCKRSGCLKNYCECYEAKVACNQTCKCIGCKNMYNDPLPPHPGSKPSPS